MSHIRQLDRSGETKDGRYMTSVICLTHNKKECLYSDGEILEDAIDSKLEKIFKNGHSI